MFWVFLAGAFLIVAVASAGVQVYKDKYEVKNEFGSGGLAVFMAFICALSLTIGLFNSMYANSSQVMRGTELTKIDSFERTYQMRANNLTEQFRSYLAEMYPAHEKDIFSKIEPGKLDIYLVKYPELQASKTITELVQQVRSLQDDIYKQQLAYAETVRDMRYTVQSPWVYQWMMPNITIPTSAGS